VRNTWVNDGRAYPFEKAGMTGHRKIQHHEPIVKASVTIAAVAALSDIDAANSAMAPTSNPYSRCPKRRVHRLGSGQVPTSIRQMANAESAGMLASAQATATATSFARSM